METREFHFSEGTSNKFWRISLDGTSFTVHFGRLGTTGQAQVKEFASEAAARQAAEKLIAEKLKKGYVEQTDGSTGAAGSPTPTVRAAAPRAKPEPGAAAARETAPPAEPEPAPPDLNVERSIDLGPADRARVTYRRERLELPEPPPFDIQEAACRLSGIARAQREYQWHWKWETARIAPRLTRDEAAFWLEAMLDSQWDRHPKEMAKILLGQIRIKVPPLKALLLKLADSSRVSGEAMKAVFSLHPARAIVAALLEAHQDALAKRSRYHVSAEVNLPELAVGFGRHVAPYLSDAELAEVREIVRPHVVPQNWPQAQGQSLYDVPPPAFFLAGPVGLHAELRTVVESLPDDAYTGGDGWQDYYQRPQDVVLGLGSAELVEQQFRRLKLHLKRPDLIRAWLAHTGLSALDVPRDTILGAGSRELAEWLFEGFAVVHAPEAAPAMLELMVSSKAAKPARQWLDANPAHALMGLAPVAAGRGRLADAAAEHFRAFRRKSGAAAVEAALLQAPPEVADKVRAALAEEPGGEPFTEADTPEWLKSGLAALGRAKTPAWVTAQDLPPLAAEGRRLTDAQVQGVLAALAAGTLENPAPLVTALKEHGDRRTVDAFAWRLFERWLSEGAPPKEKWAMMAVGLLGGDASALKLTPMVRAWPGESQHQRAVLGLECLRAIGTDTALMQINGIAQKVAFKGIKAKAGECMEAIAKDRGLTRPQLEDRIVPDCGLDERGTRIFDFGPRQFRLVLGSDVKPMLRDADGKLRPDLPKPSGKDDPTLAANAVAEWKLLKKQVSDVAKIQAVRLEQSMVTGRRWTAEEFELLLVRQPLMQNLVRMLIWGVYDDAGKVAGTFRVTEDLTYADSSDETYTLDSAAQIGIVHPLHLSDAEKAAWGEILGDYEIVPPFRQLGRPVLTLEEGEPKAKELTRWQKVRIPPQSLVFTLEKLGWQRGIPEDAGIFYSHSKPFYGAGVTAVVEYEEGVPAGYMEGWDDQRITRGYFIPGIWKPEMYPDHKQRLQLAAVDPVVISEVLADLETVASKGK